MFRKLYCKLKASSCLIYHKQIYIDCFEYTMLKTIRKVERRFPKFNEIHEEKGLRDRAKQEIFLHENFVAIDKLPLDELNQNWLKNHRPSLKKDARVKTTNSLSIENFLNSEKSSLKFLENSN